MNDPGLSELSFTVSARVARPCAQVYEAVADPAQLSRYFTTGGAEGRFEPGESVRWAFDDFDEVAAVTVVEAEPSRRIVIEWESAAAVAENGKTRVEFEFEPIDGGERTLVTITETSWQPISAGARAAFANCEGWTGMLIALKAWVEHGINVREGLYR